MLFKSLISLNNNKSSSSSTMILSTNNNKFELSSNTITFTTKAIFTRPFINF